MLIRITNIPALQVNRRLEIYFMAEHVRDEQKNFYWFPERSELCMNRSDIGSATVTFPTHNVKEKQFLIDDKYIFLYVQRNILV